MLRQWRPLKRIGTFILCLLVVISFVYLTSVDFLLFERIPLENEDSQIASEFAEFASFQSAMIKLMSRKKDGKLEMILSVDSADMEELIQDHQGDSVTANPFPIDPHLTLSNPSLCKDLPDLDWIVYVHTSCNNFDRRLMLRKTWANTQLFKDASFKVIFLMGRASLIDQEKLKEEFDKYGDIVQGDFVDDYKNLTLKALMGLKWISQYCPHVPYAMKADDDSFVNIFELVRLMKENRRKSSVIMCPLWQNNTMPILRDRKTCMKWCVKRRELPGLRFFPQYCAGIAFVLSRQIVKQLYEASKKTPFFWIDDVYITGLLPMKVPDKIDYVDLNQRMTLREDLALDNYKNLSLPISHDVVHVHDAENFKALWNWLLDRLTDTQKNSLKETISHYKV